jgi:hypothetical protein
MLFKFIRTICSLTYSIISILQRICLNFTAGICFFGCCVVFTCFPPTDSPDYHWRDLRSQNVHLVYQNGYHISFVYNRFSLFLLFFHHFACFLFKQQTAYLHIYLLMYVWTFTYTFWFLTMKSNMNNSMYLITNV